MLFTEVPYFMVEGTWLPLFTLRNLFYSQIFIDIAWAGVINALRGAFSAVEHFNSSQAVAVNGLNRVHAASQQQQKRNQTKPQFFYTIKQKTEVWSRLLTRRGGVHNLYCSPPPGVLVCWQCCIYFQRNQRKFCSGWGRWSQSTNVSENPPQKRWMFGRMWSRKFSIVGLRKDKSVEERFFNMTEEEKPHAETWRYSPAFSRFVPTFRWRWFLTRVKITVMDVTSATIIGGVENRCRSCCDWSFEVFDDRFIRRHMGARLSPAGVRGLKTSMFAFPVCPTCSLSINPPLARLRRVKVRLYRSVTKVTDCCWSELPQRRINMLI